MHPLLLNTNLPVMFLQPRANNKGLFIFPNLKPGGPYTIIISSTGFKADTLDNVNLTLGNNPTGSITLQQKDQMLYWW